MYICRSAVRAHPVPLSTGPLVTAPELMAFDPTALVETWRSRPTEVVTRDHDVGLMSLIPCPLGSISAGLVGGVSNPGPNHCLKLGTIEGQWSYR